MTVLIALLHEIGRWWLFLAAIIGVYVALTALLIWRMDESSVDQAQPTAYRGAREGLDE